MENVLFLEFDALIGPKMGNTGYARTSCSLVDEKPFQTDWNSSVTSLGKTVIFYQYPFLAVTRTG
jgi:hypothetical protein